MENEMTSFSPDNSNFRRIMTPDDEAEMNEITTKILDIFVSDGIDKNCACTVMLHLIAHLLNNRNAVDEYAKELPKLWNMYKRQRDEIEKYD